VTVSQTIHDYLIAHRGAVVDELTGWVRLRSVAGLPEHLIDLTRSVNWLAGTLQATGFPSVEVWDTDGGPAVHAEWCAAPGAPTVLVHSHHDVRAGKDEQREQTPPFEPALRDGYLYGRGTCDAEGPGHGPRVGGAPRGYRPAGAGGRSQISGRGRGGDRVAGPGAAAGTPTPTRPRPDLAGPEHAARQWPSSPRQGKADDELKVIPVVVFTTSGTDSDMLASYDTHANAYVTNPSIWMTSTASSPGSTTSTAAPSPCRAPLPGRACVLAAVRIR
jgi:hypothetical protein